MLPDCTRHPEGLALLQSCKENPSDIAPRLILSDWLEEHGEEAVARTLRKSLEGEPGKMPQQWAWLNECVNGWFGFHGKLEDFPDREGELSPWLCSLSIAVDENTLDQLPRFIAAIKGIDLQRLALHAKWWLFASCFHESIRNGEPFNESKTEEYSQKTSRSIIGFLGARPFNNIAELRLDHESLSPEEINALTSSAMRQLVRLEIGTIANHPEFGLESLIRSPVLSNVSKLQLTYAARPNNALSVLHCSPHLKQLNELDLSGNDFWESGIRIPQDSTFFQNLERLNLSSNHLSSTGAKTILQHLTGQKLTHLNLNNNWLGDEGCRVIAASENMQPVKILRLQNNSIWSEGVRALTESPFLSNLKTLQLDDNWIGDGLRYLRRTEQLPELRELSIRSIRASRDAMIDFIRSPMMRQLSSVDFGSTDLSGFLLAPLADGDVLPNLESVGLSGKCVHQSNLTALTRSTALPNLREIELSHKSLEAADRQMLAEWAASRGVRVISAD